MRKRILEISKKYNLVHIGSSLSAVEIIDKIYSIRKENEPFILSCGHSGISLYVTLEKYFGLDAEDIYKKHGVHSVRCEECKMYCTTGSLGHGLAISVGMALADRTRRVFCLTSDGEWAEGEMYETLNFARNLKLDNLKVFVNCNGFGGMGIIDTDQLKRQIENFGFPVEIVRTNMKPLKGLKAHYERIV